MFKSLKNWWIRRQLVKHLIASIHAIESKNVPAYLDAQLAFWDLLPAYKGADSTTFFTVGKAARKIAEVELAAYAVAKWVVQA